MFYKIKLELFGVERMWHEAISKNQNDFLKAILKTKKGNFFYLRNTHYKKYLYEVARKYNDHELSLLANGI